jgi:putative ABC transport system permease protein
MPDWASHVRAQLASLRLASTREQEIVDELSQHLDDRWRELIAGGATPEEATRLALAEFSDGDLLAPRLASLRQAHPPVPITPGAPTRHLVGDLWQDVRYAARTLLKQPGFTIIAVLTLALGIGANAAIFAVINSVLLRPLPLPHADQLLAVYTRFTPASGYGSISYFSLSGPEFVDVHTRVNAFARVAAYDYDSRNLTLADGTVERVRAMTVTSEFFDVLGVQPAFGRTFTDAEAQRRGGCVALLAYDASDTAGTRVGSTIRLDDGPCAVIGVMPEGFGFQDYRVKVWTPLRIDPEDTRINRMSHLVLAIARLRDGVGVPQAEAQLQSLEAYWATAYPFHYGKGGHFVVVRSLHEDVVGDQRDALLVLGGAVLFVLLIVCVNLAALLISKSEARRREFAVRHALGANRARLIRQWIAEAMLIATSGGALGVLLANALLAALLALYPRRLPVGQAITIDYVTVLFTAALVLIAGLLVSIVPALHATGTRMQESLRTDSRTATSSRRVVTARALLVVSQLALSVILLVGALLLIRSYRELQRVDLGIDPEHLLTFSVYVPPGRAADPAVARRTLAAIEQRLADTPGVEVAGAISNLPIASAGGADDFLIDGQPERPPGAPTRNARYLMATPRLFRALRIPLKRGRLLSESDVPGQPLVAVINETAARRYWPDEDPIGKSVRYFPKETSSPIRIIGIVGDVRSAGAGQPAPPAVYVPFAQAPRPPYEGRAMTFIVRVPDHDDAAAGGDPTALVATARAAVAAIDPGLPLADVRTMTDVISNAAGQPRFTTLVMSCFAIVAFVLAALGLYGILSYAVEQRIREIGVRVALGAGRRDIFRLIVGNGLRLAFAGVLVGVPAALALTRLMRGVLSGISSTDPVTYLLVIAMLAASALLATYLPARRATRVDPLIALRTD